MYKFSINVEIIGCLWRGGDRVDFSARHNGEIIYCSVDALEQSIVEDARKRGVSTGEMCDIINQQINAAEHERMQKAHTFGEVTFKLTTEQVAAWEAIFAPLTIDAAEQTADGGEGA